LEKAPKNGGRHSLIDQIDSLRVIGRCDCGCASVDFEVEGQSPPAKQVADATGTTPAGGKVGVIVWAIDERLTGLEIYDLGAGDDDLRLPTVESIEAWGRRS
jgi:hypothetical protein